MRDEGPLSPWFPGNPGVPGKPVRPGCPGSPRDPWSPGGPGGPGGPWELLLYPEGIWLSIILILLIWPARDKQNQLSLVYIHAWITSLLIWFAHCSQAVRKLVWQWSASCAGMQSLPGKWTYFLENVVLSLILWFYDALLLVHDNYIKHTRSPFSPLWPGGPCKGEEQI